MKTVQRICFNVVLVGLLFVMVQTVTQADVQQPTNPPILETYGDAMNYLKEAPNARVQRLDWVPQQYIFVDNGIVTIHLGGDQTEVYQDMIGYNLSDDLAWQWRGVK